MSLTQRLFYTKPADNTKAAVFFLFTWGFSSVSLFLDFFLNLKADSVSEIFEGILYSSVNNPRLTLQADKYDK